MTNNAIARRYAKALVQLASEGALLETFSAELTAIDRLFADHAALKAALVNPAFTADQKKNIMQDIITKLGCSPLVANFLLLLVDKGRIACLPDIVSTYRILADEQAGVIRPVITTAYQLDQTQVDAITKALEERSGKKVLPTVSVDATLIGGVVTQIGDIAYDSSVRTQLTRIHDILQKG